MEESENNLKKKSFVPVTSEQVDLSKKFNYSFSWCCNPFSIG